MATIDNEIALTIKEFLEIKWDDFLQLCDENGIDVADAENAVDKLAIS